MVRNQRQLDFLSTCLSGAPRLVSEIIDKCVLQVGGSMPLFLSCDRTKPPKFSTSSWSFNNKRSYIVSLRVLRMSALKYESLVLLSMLEYPTLIYKHYFTNRKLVFGAKHCSILKLSCTKLNYDKTRISMCLRVLLH